MVTRQEITAPETAARGLRRWMPAVGVCGGLTTVWALAAGIWAVRNPAAVDA